MVTSIQDCHSPLRLPLAAKTGQPPSSPAGAAPASLLAAGAGGRLLKESLAEEFLEVKVPEGRLELPRGCPHWILNLTIKTALRTRFSLHVRHYRCATGCRKSSHFVVLAMVISFVLLCLFQQVNEGFKVGSGHYISDIRITIPILDVIPFRKATEHAFFFQTE